MNKIKYKIEQLSFLINHARSSKFILEDIYGLKNIDNLIVGKPILPITEKSLRPFELQFLVNEIIINNRKNIIEFGSGISTIIIARLFQQNSINGKLVSVDHDADWLALVKRLLENEDLANYAELIYAPLKKYKIDDQMFPWYDKEKIILDEASIDLVLVDGPPSFSKEVEMSRYFALPNVYEKLSKNCIVMLDDAQRGGEKKVLKKWTKEFDLKFRLYSNTLGASYIGDYFISNPLKGNEQ